MAAWSATWAIRLSLQIRRSTQLPANRFLSSSSASFPAKHQPSRRSIPADRMGMASSSIRSGATEERSDSIAVPKSVPVRLAHEMLQSGHSYLDVRTVEEFNAGHAMGAINIPYLNRGILGMTKNTKFVEEVSSAFGKDVKIVVGCQSGKRSLMATSDLLAAGYTEVCDVEGGYLAWVQAGLPANQ